MLVSAVNFHTLKAIATWLKYAGMAFSTYLSIYQLSRKTSDDKADGEKKSLNVYGRHYRSLLIASLVFTIAVSLIENMADSKINAERDAANQKYLQEQLKNQNEELLKSFLPVVNEQKGLIQQSLGGLNKDITKLSTETQSKIIGATNLNNQLLEHRVRDLAQANDEILRFWVELTPVYAKFPSRYDDSKSIFEHRRYVDVKKVLEDRQFTLCDQNDSAECITANRSEEAWRYAYTWFELFDPNERFEFSIGLGLNRATVAVLQNRERIGDALRLMPSAYWYAEIPPMGRTFSAYFDSFGEGIRVQPINDDMFGQFAWHGTDLNPKSFIVRMCDTKQVEDDIEKQHMLSSPLFTHWRIAVHVVLKKPDGSGPLIRAYDAYPLPTRPSPGSCQVMHYAIY